MDVKLLDLTAQYANLREEIRQRIDEVCDSQQFILGQTVEQFEQNLARYCQTKHAIGVSSGSDALLCAMMAMNIGPGDEVICPAFTFFSTAGSIARLGARPIFVDIDPATFNIDPNQIEDAITEKTSAIAPVHLFGQLAEMEAINEIACRHDLPVIEDAAQAIGAKRNEVPACAHGYVGCLSFFPSKNLGGFGDAGAICTNFDEVAERVKLLRVHGMEQRYYHQFIGGNFRIDALQAAVLDVKLKHLDAWHAGRQKHAALYDELLAGSSVTTPAIAPGNTSIYNQYTIRVPERDKVLKHLQQQGIGCAVYYPVPLHLQACFAHLGGREGDLPATEQACREVLSLPVYPELSDDQIRHVAAKVLEAVQ